MTLRVNHSDFGQENLKRNRWAYKAPHGTTLENMIKPDFWSNVAKVLREYDEIIVMTDDKSFYAEFIVLSCDHNSASVGVKFYQEIDKMTFVAPSENVDTDEESYKIEFDVTSKWRAVRKADGAAVVSGYGTKKEAEYALSEYLQRMIAA